jgi:hypothetical protein
MPSGIYKRTEEHNRKISETNKKIIHTLEWNEKVSEALRGSKLSEEHKRKIAETFKKKGIIPPSRKGAKLTEEHKKKISLKMKGHPFFGGGFKLGKNHWNWKDGITSRVSYQQLWWKKLRKNIYERDNWTCQNCGEKCHNNIQCHHIIPVKLGGNHISKNLITLCKSCHPIIEVISNTILNIEVVSSRQLKDETGK